ATLEVVHLARVSACDPFPEMPQLLQVSVRYGGNAAELEPFGPGVFLDFLRDLSGCIHPSDYRPFVALPGKPRAVRLNLRTSSSESSGASGLQITSRILCSVGVADTKMPITTSSAANAARAYSNRKNLFERSLKPGN